MSAKSQRFLLHPMNRIILILLILVLVGCSDTVIPDQPLLLEIPAGFPAVPVPADNPLSTQKIALGRRLFYDTILSLDNSIACASCHKQEHAFADITPTSIGVHGEIGVRNSPAIANAGYAKILFFDGRANSLDEQILGALTNPAEMYATEDMITARLQNHAAYPALFRSAFGESVRPTARTAVQAIASFVRTILSGNSPYDRFTRGDSAALSATQRRGLTLFFSDRTHCSTCHAGFNFSDEKFHSTGLYSHYYDVGRFNITQAEKDRGTFRTPTLRNIALTAPYMHDGETFTLQDVLHHYNSGGKPFVNKDSLIIPLNLTDGEIVDIIAFLQSLTDEKLITNPKFAKP